MSSPRLQRLSLHGAGVRFGKRWVFRGISLHVHAGSLGVITGPNGSGKSTLLRVLAGLLRATEGTLACDAPSVRNKRTLVGGQRQRTVDHRAEKPWTSPLHLGLRVGYVPQHVPDGRGLPVTTLQAILSGSRRARWYLPWVPAAARRQAESLAHQLGIASQLAIPLHSLSGGQRRCTWFAATLTSDPDILLLDEPSGDLDPAFTERIRRAVGTYVQHGGIAIITTHQREDWTDCADWSFDMVSAPAVPTSAKTGETNRVSSPPQPGKTDGASPVSRVTSR